MAFRVIQQSLWTDEKILDNYSCEDKYFWLYLLTNPQSNQLGIYKLPLKLAAFQLGYSKEQVIVLLDRFERVLNQIRYNRETQEIAIGNFLFHSVITGGKPVINTIEKDISKVTDTELFDFVIDKLSTKVITNQTVLVAINLLKEKRTKKENNKENKKNNNDNDNDNDNGDSWGESGGESEECSNPNDSTEPEEKKPKKAKIEKHRYGEYKHVRLSDEEYMKLQRDFQNAKELITYLDEYIEMKGYKANSHYLAIRKWVVNAVEEQKLRTNKATGTTGKPVKRDDSVLREWMAENGGDPDELDNIR